MDHNWFFLVGTRSTPRPHQQTSDHSWQHLTCTTRAFLHTRALQAVMIKTCFCIWPKTMLRWGFNCTTFIVGIYETKNVYFLMQTSTSVQIPHLKLHTKTNTHILAQGKILFQLYEASNLKVKWDLPVSRRLTLILHYNSTTWQFIR